MSDLAMKKYDTLQIAVRTDDFQLDTVKYPLGFMSYWDGKAASRKLRDTISDWARGYSRDRAIHPIIHEIDNKPLSGFRVVDFSSRWSTSNKWIRVQDPRGFTLEISVNNLIRLIQDGTITSGVIQSDCIWLRDSRGNNVLAGIDSEDYKAFEKQEVMREAAKNFTMRDIQVGDEITYTHYGNVYKTFYLGKFVGEVFCEEYEYTRRNYLGWGHKRQVTNTPPQTATLLTDKAWHVFASKHEGSGKWKYEFKGKITNIIGLESGKLSKTDLDKIIN
ncbi:MAG: hypothetical protein GWN01_15740, partial [Nitrosopumilaceae archaeon]|nr:hypothetical protein [Nitrosopumilaceae archaeon]NIU88746.1 hypothetical protein [Nitrosopumilaceae archaeon]NIV66881.1 hypothetical protein [Nitrosopumilaceae archaeon]NIX62895.1 hypothetical protein [Nitrosopumilaceae archaeon]